MQVPFELESRLTSLAQLTGRSSETLLQEAIERYTDETERFVTAVDLGIASADRGQFVEDEDVRAWLETREHRR